MTEGGSTKADDIEASLQLCLEMGSPSVVIPASMIERRFPAKRAPGHPNTPTYDLDDLREWAKAKGWGVTFATTGAENDLRIVPGVRFTPSSGENNPVEKQKDKPSADHWYKKPPAVIGIAVVSGLILLGIKYLFSHHFGVSL